MWAETGSSEVIQSLIAVGYTARPPFVDIKFHLITLVGNWAKGAEPARVAVLKRSDPYSYFCDVLWCSPLCHAALVLLIAPPEL